MSPYPSEPYHIIVFTREDSFIPTYCRSMNFRSQALEQPPSAFQVHSPYISPPSRRVLAPTTPPPPSSRRVRGRRLGGVTGREHRRRQIEKNKKKKNWFGAAMKQGLASDYRRMAMRSGRFRFGFCFFLLGFGSDQGCRLSTCRLHVPCCHFVNVLASRSMLPFVYVLASRSGSWAGARAQYAPSHREGS